MTRGRDPESSLGLPSREDIKQLPEDGGNHWNRLIFESSPYLLQHAANPVSWRPWGDSAFEKARSEGKPILLSIGYATCHWCHVMAHESFEDEAIARQMNRDFICIKVDKEERPDVDDIYMTACQAMTGSGGWPLTLFLTHDKKPFFAGTYFPKTTAYGRMGFPELMQRVARTWQDRRQELLDSAENLTGYVETLSRNQPGPQLGEETLGKAYDQLAASFDEQRGGFGNAPKFLTPHHLSFLLRYADRSGDKGALNMVETTLRAMRKGGIFDHLGYGFHRYATDGHWLVPHFEKMLYDQALLVGICVETFQFTGNPFYQQMAAEVISYLMEDLAAPQGGFYSAEDADSEGVEGKFYVWRRDEIIELLGASDGKLFCQVFQIEEQGNFHEETTGRMNGDNIPHMVSDMESWSSQLDLPLPGLHDRLQSCRETLLKARKKRIHPLRDDKILTDWNGLAIAALAFAGRALNKDRYLEEAERAADFVMSNLRSADGRLLKRFRAGQAGLAAHLDDYAFVIWGLLELYQATCATARLKQALNLAELLDRHFHNSETGGYFLTSDDGEALIVRSQKVFDGAVPSGNSVMACNLVRLHRITGDPKWQDRADGIFKAFSGQLVENPTMSTHLMLALDMAVGPTRELLIAGSREQKTAKAMVKAWQQRYLPRSVMVFCDQDDSEIGELAPYTLRQKAIGGQPTAYLCENFSCHSPLQSVDDLVEKL